MNKNNVNMDNFHADDESYKYFRKIISDCEKSSEGNIKSKIFKTMHLDNDRMYLRYVGRCLQHGAVMMCEPDINEIFKKYFFDDLKKINPLTATIVALTCAGLSDILMYYSVFEHKSKQSSQVKDDISKKHAERYSLFIDFINHADTDIPLIIVGDTGTSKELYARAIHSISKRNKGPFEEINCAAIPESILESELFGVIANYPGFHNRQPLIGKILRADGGIIFLDELGKMNQHLQVKLLKAIEEKQITPLGGTTTSFNIRFIAASQPKDMENIIPDLKYRLGFPDIIQTPTLKERMKEYGDVILDLTLHKVLIKMQVEDNQKVSLSDEYDILNHYNYPGNYRELENIFRCLIISAFGRGRKEIIAEDFKGIANVFDTTTVDCLSYFRSAVKKIDTSLKEKVKVSIEYKLSVLKSLKFTLEQYIKLKNIIKSRFDLPPDISLFERTEKLLKYGLMTEVFNRYEQEISWYDMITLDEDQHLNNMTGSYKNVQLKDIIDEAEKIKIEILEQKILDVLKEGKDLKSVLMGEGLSQNDYVKYLRKITNITGKGINDLKKIAKGSSSSDPLYQTFNENIKNNNNIFNS